MEIFYFLLLLLRHGKREYFLLYLSFFTGLSGLIIDSLFNFPFHKPTYTFFSAIMFGIVHYHAAEDLPEGRQIKNIFTINYRNRIITPILIGLFFILTLFFSKFFYDKYQTYKLHKDSMVMARHGQMNRAIPMIEQAIQSWPYSNIMLFDAANLTFQAYLSNRNQITFQKAVEINNLALKSFPYHYRLVLIKLQLALFSNNINQLREAERILPTMLRVTPVDKFFTTYAISGDICRALGNTKEAEIYYTKALKFNPGHQGIRNILNSLHQSTPDNFPQK
jgi:tetratricopeptide (TPR) repeat protein